MVEDKKILADLRTNLNSQEINYEIYTKGSEFIAIEPYSARAIYGSKYKKVIIEKFGEEYFEGNADYHGNKPIDFKIACINTANAGHFNVGSEIIINVIQNSSFDDKYAGSHKVIEQGKNRVVILFPFLGDAKGIIISKSRLFGLEKAIEKTKNKIAEILNQQINNSTPRVTVKNRGTDILKIIRRNKGLFFILIIIATIYFINKFKNQKS